MAQVTLDDRYVNKFIPLDSMAIYPNSGHALLYASFDRWNEMPYKSYICLAHFVSSPPMLMPHKHQPSSNRLIINTCQHLAWSSLNGMIHLVSSCDLIGLSITTLLALHRCLCPSVPSLCSIFSDPPRAVHRSNASDFPFTLATGPSTPSHVLIFST
jgi:hypothetical protein